MKMKHKDEFPEDNLSSMQKWLSSDFTEKITNTLTDADMLKIAKLEKKLLAWSNIDDVIVLKRSERVDDLASIVNNVLKEDQKMLTLAQIKKEISVLARILVNGYGGRPFHAPELKLAILEQLTWFFDTNDSMSVAEFFEKIGWIVRKIPDGHLVLRLGDETIRHRKRKYINVGENIAKDLDYKIEKIDDFATIAVPSVDGSRWRVNSPDKFLELAKSTIKDTKAIIVDLRGNGGGETFPLDWLAKQLYGVRTPACKNAWIRGTSEGTIFRDRGEEGLFNKNNDINHIDLSKDPTLWGDTKNNIYPQFSGVEKPIYILTDSRVASSAEIFITRMSHHPFVKIVGDNTMGCAVYWYSSEAILPNTGIIIRIANTYRELEAGNIECKGYIPDIRVVDGEDALNVAKADFLHHEKTVK